MAWRKPTARDLVAKLNEKELLAFKQHPDFRSLADPASDILEQTAEMVRGFCRSNKQVRMSTEPATIPESLMSAAMDIAAYDVLKRIAVPISEARQRAWEKALELLEKAAQGAFIPESDVEGESDADSNRARPNFGTKRRRFILNEYL